MKLTINGTSDEIPDSCKTISQLLVEKSVEMPEMVSVELNGTMVDRESFASTPVSTGDVVEFLYFMGGGSFCAGV